MIFQLLEEFIYRAQEMKNTSKKGSFRVCITVRVKYCP